MGIIQGKFGTIISRLQDYLFYTECWFQKGHRIVLLPLLRQVHRNTNLKRDNWKVWKSLMKHFGAISIAREVPVQHCDLVTTLKLMGNGEMLQKSCFLFPSTGMRIGHCWICDPAVQVLLGGRLRS